MVNTADIRQGDIYHLRVGVHGQEKLRPCVIVQDETRLTDRPVTIVASISTALRTIHPERFVHLSRGTANLSADSIVDCGLLYCIPKTALTEKLGSLPHEKTEEIVSKVVGVFRPS